AALEARRDAMIERLSNRHQSRTAAAGKAEGGASSKPSDSFLSEFSKSKNSVESRLLEILRKSEPTQQKPDLDALSVEISALEKLAAEQSYLLLPYELRTCLNSISQLKQSLDKATALVVPRKKFSFKNKPSSRKPTSPPSAAVKEAATIIPTEPQKKLNSYNTSSPGLRNRHNEELVEVFSSPTDSHPPLPFTLSALNNCEVRLKGSLRALFIDQLMNCKVYVGVVMGSVLIDGAEDCIFIIASHQIRIHNARNCDFYLRLRSRPIIEDCRGVRFSPYRLSYQGLEKQLMEADLSEESGNWENVDDFRWLKGVRSPNWSVLPENERLATVDI
ncbi:hypothetical protein M569_00346, partial [Genlisea aurea]